MNRQQQPSSSWEIGSSTRKARGRKDNPFKACTAGRGIPPPPSKGHIGGTNAGQGKSLYTQEPEQGQGGIIKTGKNRPRKGALTHHLYRRCKCLPGRPPGQGAESAAAFPFFLGDQQQGQGAGSAPPEGQGPGSAAGAEIIPKIFYIDGPGMAAKRAFQGRKSYRRFFT